MKYDSEIARYKERLEMQRLADEYYSDQDNKHRPQEIVFAVCLVAVILIIAITWATTR